MNSFLIYKIALLCGGLLTAACGAGLCLLKPETLPRAEKLPRERVSGMILAWAALLWCVPHTRPIAFEWMQNWLYPAALILPVAGFFLLDNLFARAFAGLMILCGYYLVHGAFEFHSFAAPVLTLFGWSWGIGGILISAKPCWMRDFLRLAARKKTVRYAAAAFCFAFAVLLVAAAFLHFAGKGAANV